jgi:hypothetical protein
MNTTIPTSAEVKLMLYRCGLSQTDAANYLGKDARVVRRWISGEYEMPSENWRSLSDLCDQMDKAARNKIEEIKGIAARFPGPVRVNIARTDAEAQQLGYPCAGAMLAVVMRVMDWVPEDVRIIPMHRDLDSTQQEVMRLRNFIRNS